MTVRKIIELIDYIEDVIGDANYSTVLQDYIVTIDNNQGNLVLLKDITDKAISDYRTLEGLGIPDLLSKVLVNDIKPFTENDYPQQLNDIKEQNHSDPSSLYNALQPILNSIRKRIKENIAELDKIKSVIEPFLSKDYSEIQNDHNAIFALIFSNESSYNNLKKLSYELKNWDKGLHLYQQLISDETPKAFEIIEVDQGSIEVVINLLFDVAEKLIDLFKTGFEVYGAYLAYKTIVQETLIKTYKGNEELIKMEEPREKLLLENIRTAVKEELKSQTKKAKKANQESLDKKIDEVTKIITEHIIKGNSVKLLSAPESKSEVFTKEKEKQFFFNDNITKYEKLDEASKQLLLEDYTTIPPKENYEKE